MAKLQKNHKNLYFSSLFQKGFDKKAKKSAVINHLSSQNIIYIKNPKIDISSSRIRKFLKKT